MEMVQEQLLQLKMKLLLGYNMKTVVLCVCVCVCVWGGGGGGGGGFNGGIFLGGGRLSKACADDGILVK